MRVWSAELSANGAIEEYELGHETPGRGWIDHVQGVTAALASTGHAFPGFEAAIRSTVPIGAGLASSAALAGHDTGLALRCSTEGWADRASLWRWIVPASSHFVVTNICLL